MIWLVVMHLFSTLLDLIRIGRLSERDKDLEILLLRQQLADFKAAKPVVDDGVDVAAHLAGTHRVKDRRAEIPGSVDELLFGLYFWSWF